MHDLKTVDKVNARSFQDHYHDLLQHFMGRVRKVAYALVFSKSFQVPLNDPFLSQGLLAELERKKITTNSVVQKSAAFLTASLLTLNSFYSCSVLLN